jgi:hypothetical protein
MHPLTTLILITLLNLPVVAYGAEYKALVGIPGVTDPNADFSSYINSLYVLSISVAALLAVIKIVIAGMKYMLSDIVTNKAEAKKDIEGAIIGLLVVLAAVLILTVINPKITNTAITFEKLPTLKSPVAPVVVGGGLMIVRRRRRDTTTRIRLCRIRGFVCLRRHQLGVGRRQ